MSRWISITEMRGASGLRLAGIRGVPSPWTEAAKGIFRVKGLECQYAAQGEGDPDNAIADWLGSSSVPVVVYEGEAPRTGWAEILHLAERLAPQPALIPLGVKDRALMFGLAHEICGEMGFGWAYRLHMVKQSLSHDAQDGPDSGGSFPSAVANMLGAKYGMNPQHAPVAKQRVIDVLSLLDGCLGDGKFLVGDSLSAADIYWATFANLILPLPEAELPAVSFIRDAYTCRDDDILAAATQRLRDHQRRIYDNYLELPVVL